MKGVEIAAHTDAKAGTWRRALIAVDGSQGREGADDDSTDDDEVCMRERVCERVSE